MDISEIEDMKKDDISCSDESIASAEDNKDSEGAYVRSYIIMY